MSSFVRIALAGAGSFAEVGILEGDTISRLAERACVKFPSWKADAAQISLFLVAAEGDEEPTEEAIGAVLTSGRRLGVGWPLSRAGISSGAWLVARKITDSGASCSCFARACRVVPLPYFDAPRPGAPAIALLSSAGGAARAQADGGASEGKLGKLRPLSLSLSWRLLPELTSLISPPRMQEE